jgi:serine O-acetyltransferase
MSEGSTFELQAVVRQLALERQRWREAQRRSNELGGREFPSREAIVQLVQLLKGVLFPMRLGPIDLRQSSEDYYVGYTLDAVLHGLREQIQLELHLAQTGWTHAELQAQALAHTHTFATALPEVRRLLDSDVLAAFHGDPAARSVDEVLLCYPGILAMIHHRLAHQLYRQGLGLLARIISEIAHSTTGIDIHPGAHIGGRFFIDHGTGVVIGETAVIGERVRIYQNVTLGAKRFAVDAEGHLIKNQPRHPVLEDDVVVYAGATVLGRVRLGQGATIGGNVWLTHDVPAGTHITQAANARHESPSP